MSGGSWAVITLDFQHRRFLGTQGLDSLPVCLPCGRGSEAQRPPVRTLCRPQAFLIVLVCVELLKGTGAVSMELGGCGAQEEKGRLAAGILMPMALWTPPREALASSKISLWPLNPGSRKFSSIHVDKESLRQTPLLGISSTWLSLSHAGRAKAVYCNRESPMSFWGQHRQLTRWTCYRSREVGSKQGLLVLCAAVRK